MKPLKVNKKTGGVAVDPLTHQSVDCPWIFSGGDITGHSGTTVEATNDGKVARYLKS